MSTLMDLQRRNIAQMEVASPPAEASVLTEVRTPVSTDAPADASTEASKEALTEARQQGSTPVRKPARTEAIKPVRKEARQEGRTNDFLEAVDAALASREPLVGGVKATVDMSPDLSTRAKRYLADHRGQNTRQVLIALFDAFLTAKGY